MFKVDVIKNKNTTNTGVFSTEPELQEWLNFHIENKTFGKHSQPWTEQVLVSPAIEAIYEDQEVDIPAIIDEETGEEIEPARTEIQKVLIQEAIEAVYENIHHPADFTWVIEDKTSEMEAHRQIADAKAYLSSTDYMAIREFEGGEIMPLGIKNERAAKRLLINSLEVLV